VSNVAPIAGGEDNETPSQTFARFTAAVAAIGLCTPVAVANSCIGVTVPGTTETVVWAVVYEPWIILAQRGVTPLPAGFQVYIDNGSGIASAPLIAAVTAKLNGNLATGDEGARPAGVPYSVFTDTPVFYSVAITGNAVVPGLDAALTAAVTSAINQYASGLAFGQPAEASQMNAVAANQVAGNITSLSVVLTDVNGTNVVIIQPVGTSRAVMQSLSVVFN
jgi:hypothetical protein